MLDVGVVGGGIAGMATAARLQAKGLRTMVFDAHGQPGGCAGFFRRKGFAFDVGATTLVDFESTGVGGELYASIGLPPLEGELLPGYVAWLPDRTVTLYREQSRWHRERLTMLGDSPAHRRFWQWLDRLADVFWNASRAGAKLPIQSIRDLFRAVHSVGLFNTPLLRYLRWTVADALRACGLQQEVPLRGLLSMLLEDTVHASIDDAPLINGALGITIRGAGLIRHVGGMYGFWQRFLTHYRNLGGSFRPGCPVKRIHRHTSHRLGYRLETRRGNFEVRQVVSAVPAELTSKLAPPEVELALRPWLTRDANSLGGALIVFLGVPESEVAPQSFTHHQFLQDYARPLGEGNNAFVSVSAPGDTESAPADCRTVMISTHCQLANWEGLTPEQYTEKKETLVQKLIHIARRAYPSLGERAVVCEVGTPHTYHRFTSRPRGAVGGVRQSLANSNQRALPNDIGIPGFWMVGDSTWPGLGTVACVLGSRLVAERVLADHKR